jgi:hypothetical protein
MQYPAAKRRSGRFVVHGMSVPVAGCSERVEITQGVRTVDKIRRGIWYQAAGVEIRELRLRHSHRPKVEAGFMHWRTNFVFGSHLVGWLALLVVVALGLAVRFGAGRVIFWPGVRKRGEDKSEKDYWRIHGGE